MGKSMDLELIIILMVQNIKEIGKMINKMVMVYFTFKMAIVMKVTLKIWKEQEMEFIIMLLEINMKENIDLIKEMVPVFSI